jgi:hypothetical protein
MKKFVLAALLALPLIGLAQQKASAWCSVSGAGGFGFGVGVDVSFKWKWFRECGCHCGGCGDGSGGMYPVDYMGQYGSGSYAPAVSTEPASSTPGGSTFPPMPKAADTPPASRTGYPGGSYLNNGYQPVGFYYYPYTSNGYYQAPSYWYGQ